MAILTRFAMPSPLQAIPGCVGCGGNLAPLAEQHGISKRTLERVRAKLRRLGLIDHVSRFNAQHGYREGWVLSPRFARSLTLLADKVHEVSRPDAGAREKDHLLLDVARARRDVAMPARGERASAEEQNYGRVGRPRR